MKGFNSFAIVLFTMIFMITLTNTYAIENYYPLEKDRQWDYSVTFRNHLGATGSVKMNVKNFASTNLNGRKVIPQQVTTGNDVSFFFIVDDDSGLYEIASQKLSDIQPKIKEEPDYYLRYPIKVGTKWDEIYKTKLLQEKVQFITSKKIVSTSENVFVPAGSFENCIHVEESGGVVTKISFGTAKVEISVHHWYAPNVGLIKSIIKEKSNNLLLGFGEGSLQLLSFKD